MSVSSQQEQALHWLRQGYNVFLTGGGGVGKTFVLKQFCQWYRQRHGVEKFGLTSTTGIAAILCNGTTLHSFLGIGLGRASVDELATKIKRSRFLLQRWRKIDMLVIDEISMLNPDLFDKLETLARILRRNSVPFGGIQLVCSGDFCQLPCVDSQHFCFEAKTWDQVIQKTVYLTEIWRQQDGDFQRVLSEIRLGLLSSTTTDFLHSRHNAVLTPEVDNGIAATRLFARNQEVDQVNRVEFDRLPDAKTAKTFTLRTEVVKPQLPAEMVEKLRQHALIPASIALAVGCQVLLTVNLDLEKALVNGARGVITHFTPQGLPVVRFTSGLSYPIPVYEWTMEEQLQPLVVFAQIPLRLAYALTVHKSQGATLDCVEIDMRHIFEYGQAYVALSRVRTPQGLRLLNLNLDVIQCHPRALAYYQELERQQGRKEEEKDVASHRV